MSVEDRSRDEQTSDVVFIVLEHFDTLTGCRGVYGTLAEAQARAEELENSPHFNLFDQVQVLELTWEEAGAQGLLHNMQGISTPSGEKQGVTGLLDRLKIR